MPSSARSLACTTTSGSLARHLAAAALAVRALGTAAGVHAGQGTGAAHGIAAAAGLVRTDMTCTMC